MTDEYEGMARLGEVAARLDEAGMLWVIFAGTAASLYGADRPVTDLDILVPAKEGERLKALFPGAKVTREQDLLHVGLAGVDLLAGLGAIDLDGEMREHVNAFHARHQQRFSYANHKEPVEIVNLRVKAVGRTAKPRFTRRASGGLYPDAAQVGHKVVYFADRDAPHAARPIPTALYDRDRLDPGNVVVGPAVLFQLDTTTIVPPDWSAMVDGWGNLLVEQ